MGRRSPEGLGAAIMDRQLSRLAEGLAKDPFEFGIPTRRRTGQPPFWMDCTRLSYILLAVGLAVCIGQTVLASPPDSESDPAGRIAPQEQEPARDPTEQQPAADPNAQPPPTTPGAGQTVGGQDQTGDKTEVPAAVVIEVEGSVEWAGPGVAVLADEGWTPVELNDRLEAGQQIRTGLRSHVNLRFGEATFVSVRSATYASIDQFYRSATAESVRLDLAYGTIRGGSTEGEVRSDVTVESAVAALIKRGTEGWEMQVEPMTGRFRISLARYGLVEAIHKLRSGRRVLRSVRPGEYATERNIANMWIKQDIFDRNVQFYQAEALTLADAEFTAINTRGYGTLSPGGGSTLVDLSARVNAVSVLDQLSGGLPPSTGPPSTVVLTPLPILRPEGNFGTGGIFRVLLPRQQ